MITQQPNYTPVPRPVLPPRPAALRNAERRDHPSDLRDPALLAFFGGTPSVAGVTVNESTALSVSAVFACVRNLAEDEAKLPLITYQRMKPRGKRRATEHPIYRLLHDSPNPEMTAFSFRQAVMASAALFGGGYAEIERTNGDTPLHLWPIEPWRVCPKRVGPGGRELVYEVDGGKTTLPARDMFHVPGFGINGVLGYMVACVGRDSLGLTIAAQRFAAAYFGNGTKYAGVFTHPKQLSDKAIENIRKSREALHGGPDGAHKDLFLEEGMTWTRVSADADEAQMIETRQFQVEEVCRWFRMQPGKIGHLLRAQGWSTLEATNTDYVIDTLMPWFVRWEQECLRKLVGPGETDIFCEHLVDGLLRGDSAARANFYKTMREIGAYCVDDILEMENRNPLPDDQGQVYMVPTNWMNARRAAADVPPPPPPPQPPPPPPPAPNDDEVRTAPVAVDAVLEAHRPALVDAAARAARREAEVIRRKAKSPSGLADAVNAFYDAHGDYVRTALRPAAVAYAGTMRAIGRVGVSETAVDGWAADHVARARAEVLAAVAAGPAEGAADRLEALLSDWEARTAAATAERIISVTRTLA